MKLLGHSLINGTAVLSPTSPFHAVDPATGATLPTPFHPATSADIAAAVSAAGAAFAQCRAFPAERFAALLDQIAAEILALGPELIALTQAETGLPEARLLGERARTVGQLKMFAALVREGGWLDAAIDTADPQRQPIPKPDLRRMLRPLGPVAVFGAGNFPFAFGACGGDTASALAAGNPVIVKAHEAHPGTNELYAHAVLAALKACEFPPGMFALLQGPGPTVGQALVQHPGIQAVGFTGSKRAGRALFDLAAARPTPIPVYAEMGSLNPLVILPGALADRAAGLATGLAQSITLGLGQMCTKPGVVFVLEGPRTDEFIDKLVAALSAVPAGPMLDLRIRTNFCNATEQFAKLPGVKSRLLAEVKGFASAAPYLFETDAATWQREATLHEEAFGPAAVVIRCRDLAELRASLHLASGNLTGAIHSGSSDQPEDVSALAAQLESQVGRLVFNGYPTGVEVCHAMIHGGPYPATTAALTTSVGSLAIRRFARPVCYQNTPQEFLPVELQNANPRQLLRLVNGQLTKASI